MDFRHIILISLQIMNVLSRQKYASSSDESIENLLYFKDCNKKETTATPPFIRLAAPAPSKPMDCPYPKMCCALTCGGNECSGPPIPFMGRQQQNPMMEPMQMHENFPPIEPINGGPGQRQSQMMQQPLPRNRKKKAQQPMRMQPPIGGRRSFGFAKEQIKSLINQDTDIRKILKDLVTVTMKKVDLVDKVNSGKAPGIEPTAVTNSAQNHESYDDDDLE